MLAASQTPIAHDFTFRSTKGRSESGSPRSSGDSMLSAVPPRPSHGCVVEQWCAVDKDMSRRLTIVAPPTMTAHEPSCLVIRSYNWLIGTHGQQQAARHSGTWLQHAHKPSDHEPASSATLRYRVAWSSTMSLTKFGRAKRGGEQSGGFNPREERLPEPRL
eukprot:3925281-Prymnesium_polylepis.1